MITVIQSRNKNPNPKALRQKIQDIQMYSLDSASIQMPLQRRKRVVALPVVKATKDKRAKVKAARKANRKRKS